MYANLSNQTKFRLTEIYTIKNHFNGKIQKRKVMSKKIMIKQT